mmetsp:Transcript_23218/g.65926  ORF Transcript_23218/g.65926 Transcript_23218/m.65926 type:complete len:543 (+) Transcript_23218:72-1700(+)
MGVYGPGQGQQLHVHMLVASLWASLTAGFVYSFSAYSGALRGRFNLSQPQIWIVGEAHVTMHFFTFTCGLLVDTLGVRTVLIFGSSLNAMCWFIFGAIAILELNVPHGVLVFTLLTAGATYGAACTVAAVFSALAKNFGKERGAAIGIAKAWSGVASGILLTIFMSIFPSSDHDPQRLIFLWVLAGSIVVLALLPSPLIRVLSTSTAPLKAHVVREDRHRYRRQLWLLTGATLLLICVTVGASLVNTHAPQGVPVALSVLMVTCIFMPGWLLLPGQSCLGLDPALARGLAASGAEGHEEGEAGGSRVVAASLGPLEVVRQLDAWLLWLAVFALHTGAFLLTTNLADKTNHRRGLFTLVICYSTSQSLGRLFGGFLSDALVQRRVARPWCLAILLLCMACSQLLFDTPGTWLQCVGICLAGWALGSMYPVLVCTVAEIFGTARIASNYMIFDGTPMAMACIVVARIWGHNPQFILLDGREAMHGIPSGSSHHAQTGTVFACAAVLQVVAAAGAVVLAIRTRPLYSSGVPPHAEDAGEVASHAA